MVIFGIHANSWHSGLHFRQPRKQYILSPFTLTDCCFAFLHYLFFSLHNIGFTQKLQEAIDASPQDSTYAYMMATSELRAALEEAKKKPGPNNPEAAKEFCHQDQHCAVPISCWLWTALCGYLLSIVVASAFTLVAAVVAQITLGNVVRVYLGTVQGLMFYHGKIYITKILASVTSAKVFIVKS